MSRPLRLEFPGAVYHVTARGNAGQAIFADDADRVRFLDGCVFWNCSGARWNSSAGVVMPIV